MAKLQKSLTTSSGGVELEVAAMSSVGMVEVFLVSWTTSLLRYSGTESSLLLQSIQRVPKGARTIFW